MAVPIEKQLDALTKREQDIERRRHEIIDELVEVAEEYARIGVEIAKDAPWLVSPINLTIDRIRSRAAEMKRGHG